MFSYIFFSCIKRKKTPPNLISASYHFCHCWKQVVIVVDSLLESFWHLDSLIMPCKCPDVCCCCCCWIWKTVKVLSWHFIFSFEVVILNAPWISNTYSHWQGPCQSLSRGLCKWGAMNLQFINVMVDLLLFTCIHPTLFSHNQLPKYFQHFLLHSPSLLRILLL